MDTLENFFATLENVCEVERQPPEVFYKKKRPQACNFIETETLVQVFSCEFCEIFKNIFLTEHLWTTVSSAWNPICFRDKQ